MEFTETFLACSIGYSTVIVECRLVKHSLWYWHSQKMPDLIAEHVCIRYCFGVAEILWNL